LGSNLPMERRDLLKRARLVLCGDDLVAPKHVRPEMPRNLHGCCLVHPRVNQIADGAATQVVREEVKTGALRRCAPTLPKLPYHSTIAVEDVRAIQAASL